MSLTSVVRIDLLPPFSFSLPSIRLSKVVQQISPLSSHSVHPLRVFVAQRVIVVAGPPTSRALVQ
uniref:Uncharacterized protein n=1 Tax=Cucumis melo TaxID=3656 RepID=A0A9I9CZ49_CUCME